MSNHERMHARVEGILSAAFTAEFIGDKLSALYTGIGWLEDVVTKDNAHEHIELLTKSAAIIQDFGCRYGDYNCLSPVSTNIAVNYLMVAIEALEAQGDRPGLVRELLALCDQYLKDMVDRRYALRNEPLLERFELLEHPAPKLVCDLEKARSRIKHVRTNRREFESRLEDCDRILRGLDHDIFRCRLMFEFDRHHYEGESEPVHKVVLMRPDIAKEDPSERAQAMLLAARKHVETLGKDGSDDADVNRSRRAVIICRMAVAHAKATLAEAFIRYWEKAPTFRNYKPLAQQARSFVEAVQLNNWDYYIAPVFFRAHEPILEASKVDAERLISYGDAAWAYAMALDAQMKTARGRDRMTELEPVEIERPFKPIHPAAGLTAFYTCARDTDSQAEYREWHHDVVADDSRRDAAYGRSPYKHPYIGRMVGYPTVRSGKKHKRSARRTAR